MQKKQQKKRDLKKEAAASTTVLEKDATVDDAKITKSQARDAKIRAERALKREEKVVLTEKYD